MAENEAFQALVKHHLMEMPPEWRETLKTDMTEAIVEAFNRVLESREGASVGKPPNQAITPPHKRHHGKTP